MLVGFRSLNYMSRILSAAKLGSRLKVLAGENPIQQRMGWTQR